MAASYYQTVPEGSDDNDGCNWLLEDPNCQQGAIDDTVAVWNEMEATLRNKIDDEIRNVRHRIHHLMDERKMKCDYMLGFSDRHVCEKTMDDQYEEVAENDNLLENDETQRCHMQDDGSLIGPQPLMEHQTDTYVCEFDESRDEEQMMQSSQLVTNMNQAASYFTTASVPTNDVHVMRIMKAMLKISNHLNQVTTEKTS